MKNVSKMVLAVVIGSLVFSVTANAEVTEDMKTRAALGLGAGYITSHIVKNNIAENKIVNFVMTGLAMGALSAAYDASQGRGFNAGNTGAAMVGGFTANLTFNLFDGSDKGSRAIEIKNENKPEFKQTNEQKVNINIFEDKGKMRVEGQDAKVSKSSDSIKTFYAHPTVE